MSLQVNDPRSRGRSKSPSGRIRERSKSRDTRLPSDTPRSSTYRVSDVGDEYLQSRPRDPRDRGGQRASSRYDLSDSESGPDRSKGKGKYSRTERRHDNYYHSDSGESKTTRRDEQKSYARPSHLRPVKYDSHSDDSYSDSGDDALAYGDIPSDLERDYYGYKSPARTSATRVDGPVMSGALNGAPHVKQESSRSRHTSKEDISGPQPTHAAPGRFQYVMPNQYGHIQPMNPGYPGYPPTSSVPPSNWAPIPECERPGFVPPSSQAEAQHMPGAFPPPVSTYPEMTAATTAPVFPMPQYTNFEQHNPYVPQTTRPLSGATTNAYAPQVNSPTHQRAASSDTSNYPGYANPAPFQYAHIDPNVKYTSKTGSAPYTYPVNSQSSKPSAAPKPAASKTEPQHPGVRYTAAPQPPPQTPTSSSRRENEQRFIEITPGGRTGGRPASLSVSSANNLNVAGADPNLRPASPLLEAYKGTYQSISPMPSPIVMPSRYDEDVSDLEPLDGSSDTDGRRRHSRKKSKDERDRKELKPDRPKRDSSRIRDSSRVRHGRQDSEQAVMVISPSSTRKRVTFYDPGPDAKLMQEALSHTINIDTKAITRVLPHLTSEEMLDLRKEYKSQVKLQGKGINMAKHIRLKLGNSAFGKVCYATALGRWESEAYWANCYYQSSTSRRELLIESLMGRSNGEIRAIKECFRDSRYLDSLEKCMKSELKADKFRVAVLLALEETRQSERDPVDPDLVQRDVRDLYGALMSRHGGETAMIYIIVRRSDAHLREVLRMYEKVYKQNFARAMIAKSQNLVGETLAHILNGAINRPMRDALLLHQALRESRTGKERSELLISRLVRLHWEPRHLEQVKNEYRRRYGERLEEAIAEEILPSSGGSEWGEFCIELARSSKNLVGR
ncbi:annexin ANXC4 [Aspergillus clavatus NRRL 1]|uniref:Annexin ANXC4 n=1 Tax=Aspergillus clavatus (strain ATCC 1007 / CBS 513.65 / DSM 816 / NCTC 3887 / NRRL 1 / QM 1276 / 107) TaxID=344612 RepID=A1CJH1_ASPCL|nr:annexin ANXC4 [Aspergillus clavatus NRRL 1]EAW09295.1 annexin ANXC4 [Aspergillus clavatus NRRL 1]